jgi:hypothetical protein
MKSGGLSPPNAISGVICIERVMVDRLSAITS